MRGTIVLFFLSIGSLNAQRTVTATGTPVTVPTNRYDITGDTIPDLVVGNLADVYPGYSYNQLKTVRQTNWEAFQASCNYVKSNGGRIVLPSGRVEMHVNDGETITFSQDQVLTIVGGGKDVTSLVFWPIVKTYDVNIFTMTATGTSINLSGLTMSATYHKFETYACTIRPSGATTSIRIDDATVRANTVVNFVGKTIYVAKDQITTPSPTYTVSGYNSGTKTITVSSTITGISDNDTGWIGFDFPEDTPIDSINAYDREWLKTGVEWYIIYAVQSTNTEDAKYTFNDFRTTGFDLTAYRSGGDVSVDASNCYFSGHHGAFFWYSNNETNSTIKLTNCVIENNGFEVFAYAAGDFTAGNLYGSGIYAHPNAQFVWSNVDVINNKASAVRQYSAGGNKPTPVFASSNITNCRFINNDEYALQTSQDMPFFIDNCYLEGVYYFNDETRITNSRFRAATIASYSTDTKLSISNTVIDSTTFSLDAESIDISNSSIETYHATTYTFSLSGTDRFVCNNVRFTSNAETYLSNTSLFNLTFTPVMEFINCSFEDTDTPIFQRFGPETFYITSRSNYKPVRFRGCRFANSTLVNSSQFQHRNNFDLEDCVFGTEDVGRANFKARKGLYKTTISGTTVTLSSNYDQYFTSGTIDKIVPGYLYGHGHVVYLTAASSTTFTAYNAVTKTTSNVDFTGIVSAGETVALRFNATDWRGTTTTVSSETLRNTTNGTTTYNLYGDFDNSNIKPGTLTVTIGAVTLTDDGNGNLTGSGGAGWITYDTNYITIYLNSNPGVTAINVAYDYYSTLHQAGMWIKIK